MYNENDLIDIITRELRRAVSARAAATQATPGTAKTPTSAVPPARWKFVPEPGPKGRSFLTEAVIKKALTLGAGHLTIPRDSIISPLALDWLVLKGIQIIRE